jgi:superfamily II DNA or RNA helicase
MTSALQRHILAKLSEVVTDLQPHQLRVRERLRESPGLVIAHGLGSGKTLSALAIADDVGGDATFIVPASLKSNLDKERRRHLQDENFIAAIDSLQRTGLQRGDNLPGGDVLVVDEAHRIREQGEAQSALRRRRRDYRKAALLTATPVFNRPSDIAPLVNIAAGSRILPEGQEFDAQYVREEVVKPSLWGKIRGVAPGTRKTLTNRQDLRQRLRQWVDYHANSTEGFPERVDEEVLVPLTGKQRQTYDAVMGQAPAWVQYKVRSGLPPSKSEAKQLNAFLSAARQTATSEFGFNTGLTAVEAAQRSGKITAAVNRLQKQIQDDPTHKSVIYSNFLDAGLEPTAAALDQAGIPFARFTGKEKPKDRDAAIKAYNEGRVAALLVSSAGGEGLDLKGTRSIKVLEPHWNDPKLDQVIGRGIRFGSHAHLPEDQRNVVVERYLSRNPDTLGTRTGRFFHGIGKAVGLTSGEYRGPLTVDQYLSQLSAEKKALTDDLTSILAEGTSDYERYRAARAAVERVSP